MKFFLVCTMNDTANGGTYDAKLYPFDDATRATQKDAALLEARDTGQRVYRVTDNAPAVERALPPEAVYQGLDMKASRALRDYATEQGWFLLAEQVQLAINAAKAA